jgi:hypothetical protein
MSLFTAHGCFEWSGQSCWGLVADAFGVVGGGGGFEDAGGSDVPPHGLYQGID